MWWVNVMFLGCLVLASCKQQGPTVIESSKGIIRYARHFSLVQDGRGFRLSLSTGQQYLLLEHGVQAPDSVTVIRIPVSRVVCSATTQLPLFSLTGSADAIVAFAHTAYVYDEIIRRRIRDDLVVDVGGPGGLNEEAVLALQPDLILADRSMALSERLTRRWVTITAMEAEEAHPLGRAEWIRLGGVLTGRTNEADSIFQEVERRYLSIASRSAREEGRPSVLTGIPYGGTWYLPGGGSFMTRLLRDAGYDQAWPLVPEKVVVPMGLETVMEAAHRSDHWIGVGAVRSVEELIALEPRLNRVGALRSGSVFAYDRRTNAFGGNDYFEGAVVRPDLLLQDLVRIRHDSSDHLTYYRRIGR